MWANFISHCDRREQYFTIHEVNYFTFGNAEYFTRKALQQAADDIQRFTYPDGVIKKRPTIDNNRRAYFF